jgi:hypothetical protein
MATQDYLLPKRGWPQSTGQAPDRLRRLWPPPQKGRGSSETPLSIGSRDPGPPTDVRRNQEPPSTKPNKTGVRRIPAQSQFS